MEQWYQLTVDEVKVRLNLAVCTGAWLMLAQMVINTESTVGYNNRLKQAMPGMKLGVNVNPDTKKVGVAHIEGGPWKIKRQISPGPVLSSQKPASSSPQKPVSGSSQSTAHESNKIWLIAGVGLGVFALSRIDL